MPRSPSRSQRRASGRVQGLQTAVCSGLLFAAALAGVPAAHPLLPQESAPTAPGPPTVQELEARIEALRGSDAEGAAAQAEAYQQALDALERAEAARAQAEEAAATQAQAPARIEALRRELATGLSEPELEDPSRLTLDELTDRLEQANADLAAARENAAELEQLAERRSRRKAELPEEIADAQRSLDAAREALSATVPAADGGARRALLLAQVEEQASVLAALEAERDSYEATRELLPLRRDRAQRRLARAEGVASFWKRQVDARRTEEGEAAARAARQQLESVTRRFPALEQVAERNRELAALRSGASGLPRRIARARTALEADRDLLEETGRRFRAARRRVAAGGLTEGMGLLLRRDHDWLDAQAARVPDSEARDEALSEAQLELIALEEDRAKLGDLTAALERTLAELDVDEPSEELVAAARDLLAARREALDAVLADLATLTSTFYEHEELSSRLRAAAGAYEHFIEERILWVRSSSPNPLAIASALPQDLHELGRLFSLRTALQGLARSARENVLRCLLGVALLSALLASRRFLKRKREEMGTYVRSYRSDKYVYTLRALLQTLLLALPLPIAAWTLGWLLSSSHDPLSLAAGAGLREIAPILLAFQFTRGLVAKKGVGLAHFKWPEPSLATVRRELRWSEPLVVGLAFPVLALERLSSVGASDSVGRICFVAAMAVLALVSHRLLRAESNLWLVSAKGGKGLLEKTRHVWSAAATAMPVALVVLALLGYYYTALQFELRLRYSLGFMLLVILANALLMRWLLMARRQLAVNQALEARARREEERDETGATESGTPLDADKVDIPAIDAQTRQLFKSGITLATVLGLYFIWVDVLPALQGLDRIQLLPELAVVSAEAEAPPPLNGTAPPDQGAGSPPPALTTLPLPPSDPAARASEPALGLPSTLTLADVLVALVFLLLTSVAAKNVPALLELSLLQRLPLDSGARYAVATIIRYLICLIGISATSKALGIGWQQVQWLAAALTFGLAFGLQEIFANFVSGLIILLERPIRVGDIVTVGGTEGRVTQLRMRATTILDWDRREFLIPNKEFITGNVINWTLSDPVTRVVIPVGIAYGSDTRKARSLLEETAHKSPIVLDDPAPYAMFRGFGESSLAFELRVYIGNRDFWPKLIDSLHSDIDDAFRAAGIEIAFPQRDIHVRSIVGRVDGDEPRGAPDPGAAAVRGKGS